MRTNATPIVCVLAIVTLYSAVSADGAGYGPQVGKRHPEFTLPDITTGKAVSLSDFRGKRVLLIQFASW